MGPNAALCLLVFGVLGIYCELIWPGRVWQGVLGAGGAVTGLYFFSQAAAMRFGFACLAAAVALFLLDTFVETHSLAGLSATVAMLLAFSALGVQTVWCIPVCMAFGAITVALNRLVRRARRNKRADLFTQQ